MIQAYNIPDSQSWWSQQIEQTKRNMVLKWVN